MSPQDRALLMIYTSVKARLPKSIGAVEFIESIKDWDVIPLSEAGKIIGGVLIKNNELHVGYGCKPRATIRPYIREVLESVIDKYGYATTTVQTENKVGLRFCERLGFVKLTEENGTIRLRCDRSNYKC